METMIGLFCGLAVFLSVITLVGHGFWLLASSLFRAIFDSKTPVAGSGFFGPHGPMNGTQCSNCHHPHSVINNLCRQCGLSVERARLATHVRELQATQRQLIRLRQLGILDATAYQAAAEWTAAELNHVGVQASVPMVEPLTAPNPTLPELALPSVPTPFSEPATHQSATDIEALPVSPTDERHQQRAIPPFPSAAPDATPDSVVSPVMAALIPDASSPDVDATLAMQPTATHSKHAPQPPASPPLQPSVPLEPRRTLADMLQAFMEESNIRWVELISGIVIVVCAIGLVISLRATLQDTIPYFPALMFMSVTAAIHFAGVYSLRKWNLQSTSRGVLIIASLLVPLNFLAAVTLSGENESQRAVTDPVYMLAVGIGVLCFGAMSYFGARSLLRSEWPWLAMGILGPSLSQLMIHRLAPAANSLTAVSAMLAIPIGCSVASFLQRLRLNAHRDRLSRRVVFATYLQLGLVSFSLVAAIALAAVRSADAWHLLGLATPVLSLYAAVTLALGLSLHRHIEGPSLAIYRTVGTGVAVFAGLLLLACVALAWPTPSVLILVGLMNGATLLALAFFGQMPVFCGPALACISFAISIAVPLALGKLDAHSVTSATLVQELFTTRTSLLLSAMLLIAATPINYLRKRGMTDYAIQFGIGGAVHMAASTLIALYVGFIRLSDDPAIAAPILITHAILLLMAGRWLPHPAVAWSSAALTMLAILQATWHNPFVRDVLIRNDWLLNHPIATALSIYSLSASLCSACIAWFARKRSNREEVSLFANATTSAWNWAAVSAATLAGIVILATPSDRFTPRAALMAATSLAWLVVSISASSPSFMAGAQVASSLAVSLGCAALCERTSWWDWNLMDPRHLQWQIASQAAWNLGWTSLRILSKRSQAAQRLLAGFWPSADVCIVTLLCIAVTARAATSFVMALWLELSIEVPPAEPLPEFFLHFDWTSWLGLGLCMTAAIAIACERGLSRAAAWLTAFTATIPMMAATHFADTRATASALRWGFAMYAAAWLFALTARDWLAARHRQEATEGQSHAPDPKKARNDARTVSLALAIATVVGITSIAFLDALLSIPLGGPIPESFFHRLGSTLSYSGPFAALVVVLFAYAVVDTLPSMLATASALFQYFITVACILPTVTQGLPVDDAVIANVCVWNALGLGVFALVWIASLRWVEPGISCAQASYLGIQTALVRYVNAAIAVIAFLGIVLPGAKQRDWLLPFGRPPYYLAILAAVAVTLIASKAMAQRREPFLVRWLYAAGLQMTIAIACVLMSYDTNPPWWSYHLLQAAGLSMAALLLPIYLFRSRSSWTELDGGIDATTRGEYARWSTTTLLLVVIMSILAADADPGAPWWPTLSLATATMLVSAWGVVTDKSRYILASLLYAPLAVLAWEIDHGFPLKPRVEIWLQRELTAVVLMGAAWMAVDVVRRIRSPNADAAGKKLVVPIMMWICIVISLPIFVLAIPAEGSYESFSGRVHEIGGRDAIILLLSLLAYCVLAQWQSHVSGVVIQLYVWGFLALGMIVGRLELSESRTGLAMMLGIAAYVATTAYIWNRSATLAALGGKFHMPDPIARLQHIARWLPFTSIALAAITSLYAVAAVLLFESRPDRICAGLIPACAAIAFAMLAQQHRRRLFQSGALLTAVLSSILLSWADMPPSGPGLDWLDRIVRMLIVLIGAAIVFGVVLVRVISASNDWRAMLWQAAKASLAAAAVTLTAVFLFELALFDPESGTPVGTGPLIAVSVVCVALVVALVITAAAKGPGLGLDDRTRMGCVYAAQVMAVLLFGHLYLARPHWFRGRLQQWWPYIIMAIAYGGIAASEFLRRANQRIFAEPLSRSAMFLPILPVIGMWFFPHHGSHALVLFVIGILYAALSMTQRSRVSAFIAGLAGNGALWAMLAERDGFHFTQHPQFWLIPPAASLLVAAQLNRAKLAPTQLNAVRYGSLIAIYLSSTSEVFFTSVGSSFWAPIFLSLLSLAGIAGGIGLRIRAFLYVGTAFLFLSMFSMVWHAYQNIRHVGIWWAFGIALGVGILTLYGVFEMKRREIKDWIERLRQWEK